jgi:hypothetical protein
LGLLELDADARFDALQERLVDLWPTIRTWTDDEQTVVVVPSYSIDPDIVAQVASLLPAYEERFLYMLLLLRQPNCRVVLVTSMEVRPRLIDAYLDVIPDTSPADARSRLTLVCADDPSPRPLAEKLLERDDLLETIRPAPGTRAHLAMFNVAEAERDVALRLGLPIYGAAARHARLGTKSGCRTVFAEVGIPHPRGEAVASREDMSSALARLHALGVDAAVVKLDEGVSGYGNAVVGLDAAPFDVPKRIAAGLAVQGGVVEELLTGDDLRSPSAQLRITPTGKVEILSTHDQLLGGAEGQTYLGCTFPADAAYAGRIAEDAAKVGAHLAGEGVRGRFAVDFVATRTGAHWDVRAIEINLRKGGTTHPFLTMHFLVDGAYDAAAGAYTAPDGRPKHYVAVDGLGSRDLVSASPEDVLDAARDAGLAYDPATQTGAVFHMLSALPVEGKFGVTAIGDDLRAANELCRDVSELVAEIATA